MHGLLGNVIFIYMRRQKSGCVTKICWPTFKLNVCKWLTESNGPEARQSYLFYVFVRFFPLTKKTLQLFTSDWRANKWKHFGYVIMHTVWAQRQRLHDAMSWTFQQNICLLCFAPSRFSVFHKLFSQFIMVLNENDLLTIKHTLPSWKFQYSSCKRLLFLQLIHKLRPMIFPKLTENELWIVETHLIGSSLTPKPESPLLKFTIHVGPFGIVCNFRSIPVLEKLVLL